MYYTTIPSPVGELLLAGTRHGLRVVRFPSTGSNGPGAHAIGDQNGWQRCDELFQEAATQLREYFDGRRRQFDLPLKPAGTPFQTTVLNALRCIPYGETRSYGDIARSIGKPKAVRAVGAANGRNPLPIIIPCHRVIGHDGKLTGFGGGLPAKRYLLDLEKRCLNAA